MTLDYEKMWNTLKAESGHRVLDGYPLPEVKLSELMTWMEERAKKDSGGTSDNKSNTPFKKCTICDGPNSGSGDLCFSCVGKFAEQ
jgi:hypothetical protein